MIHMCYVRVVFPQNTVTCDVARRHRRVRAAPPQLTQHTGRGIRRSCSAPREPRVCHKRLCSSSTGGSCCYRPSLLAGCTGGGKWSNIFESATSFEKFSLSVSCDAGCTKQKKNAPFYVHFVLFFCCSKKSFVIKNKIIISKDTSINYKRQP